MKANNPMKNAEIRAKVSATLKKINHQPKTRGGNGRGATIPQKMLANALGWQMEYAVKTEKPRGSGYPTCYKVDIANPEHKIAIEVDGSSHQALERQMQDKKKEALLISKGWKVIQFKNLGVIDNLEKCVQKVMSMI